MNYINQHDFYLETNGKIIDVDGAYGGQCFTKGHFITMADGNYKKIEEVTSGDYVYNKNMNRINKVLGVTIRKRNVIELNTSTNSFICTKDHPFYNGEEFIIADDLNKYDNLYFPTNNISKKYDLTSNELIWLGIWLQNGKIVKNMALRKNDYEIEISSSCSIYLELLNIKMYKIRYSKNGKNIRYKLDIRKHKKLSEVLEKCHIDNKKVLPQIFTKEQYNKIIDGYLKMNNYKKTFTSSSVELLLGLQYGLRLSNIKSRIKLGNKVHKIYNLEIIEDKKYLTKRNKKSQIVYNLMVSGDNTYICNNIAVHNCWDLFAYYTNKLCGRTFPCIETGYVIDLWNTFDRIGLNEFFEKVTSNYQDGDWLVWKAPATITTSSHIAMFRKDNGDGTNIILTQNPDGFPNYTYQMICDYVGVVGALRPKIYIPKETILSPEPIGENNTVDQVYVKANNTIYCRTSPDNTIDNKTDDNFIKIGYYNILEETNNKGYHWYKIALDRWIAQVDGYVERKNKVIEENNGIQKEEETYNNVKTIFMKIKEAIMKIIKYFIKIFHK